MDTPSRSLPNEILFQILSDALRLPSPITLVDPGYEALQQIHIENQLKPAQLVARTSYTALRAAAQQASRSPARTKKAPEMHTQPLRSRHAVPVHLLSVCKLFRAEGLALFFANPFVVDGHVEFRQLADFFEGIGPEARRCLRHLTLEGPIPNVDGHKAVKSSMDDVLAALFPDARLNVLQCTKQVMDCRLYGPQWVSGAYPLPSRGGQTTALDPNSDPTAFKYLLSALDAGMIREIRSKRKLRNHRRYNRRKPPQASLDYLGAWTRDLGFEFEIVLEEILEVEPEFGGIDYETDTHEIIIRKSGSLGS